jgi:hypothetical protein
MTQMPFSVDSGACLRLRMHLSAGIPASLWPQLLQNRPSEPVEVQASPTSQTGSLSKGPDGPVNASRWRAGPWHIARVNASYAMLSGLRGMLPYDRFIADRSGREPTGESRATRDWLHFDNGGYSSLRPRYYSTAGHFVEKGE